jgi:hypothetical protein
MPSHPKPPHRKISLKTIPAPAIGAVVSAPPVLDASDHTIDYACGSCGTILLHAEDGQVHNLTIRCTVCGSYNSTDL